VLLVVVLVVVIIGVAGFVPILEELVFCLGWVGIES
jgi:hypothetical protein